MVGRKKRLPVDAKPVAFSLGGAERIILSVIEVRRRQRGEDGETSSQIVSDALWHYLDCVEKMPREDIHNLLIKKREEASNLKAFPIKD